MEIPSRVVDLIRNALEEDIGPGDITTSLTVPGDRSSRADYKAKGDFVLAGLPFAEEVFRIVDPAIAFMPFFSDGKTVSSGDVLAEISGRTRTILLGERVSLNILQRLSGIATLTSMFVQEITGLSTRITDTRKTTPCMRFMEKYAVRIGGGYSHRFGLFDGILIKDNHIIAAGSIQEAVQQARRGHHLSKIEVEVSNLNELNQAMNAGADVVMLDNMSVPDMREAVKLSQGRVLLEASGNVSLDNVRAIAETGVDFISVGAITHSAPSADISLKLVQ